MYTNCDEIFKITIPAVRVVVAKSLSNKYKMNQQQIAKRLGITQVAVSKYLNCRYSSKIAKIEALVKKKRLARNAEAVAARGSSKEKITQSIDQVASEGYLVKETLKII